MKVFFVISGYLITNLLLHELDKTNKIHLGKFYFRRTFRIFPACYAMIAGLILFYAMGWITLTPRDVLHALTYTSNYYPGRSWSVAHTWSLGVEEQFYLLWPAALVLLGRRKGLYAAASMLLVCPIIREVYWHFYKLDGIGFRFETVADAIGTGCLLAGAHEWLRTQPLYRRFLESPAFSGCTGRRALFPYVLRSSDDLLPGQPHRHEYRYRLVSGLVHYLPHWVCGENTELEAPSFDRSGQLFPLSVAANLFQQVLHIDHVPNFQ